MVTVIIPTYKRPDNLDRAIQSVLHQKDAKFEIIVVDDNNENSEYRRDTEKCMLRYASDDRILYIKHTQNLNGAAARNSGIKASKGDYITFLDDDDYYMPNRLCSLVSILEKNPEYDCIYSGVAISERGGFVETREADRSGSFLIETLCHDTCWVTGSNLLFTKNAIEKVGLFDTSFVRHQDTEYMCRFFENGFKILGDEEYLVVKNQDDRKNDVDIEKQIKTKEHFLNKFKECIGNKWDYVCFRNYYVVLWLSVKNKNIKQYFKVRKLVTSYGNLDFQTRVKLVMRWIYCVLPITDFLFAHRRNKSKKKLGDQYKQISSFIRSMETDNES